MDLHTRERVHGQDIQGKHHSARRHLGCGDLCPASRCRPQIDDYLTWTQNPVTLLNLQQLYAARER